MVEGGRGGEGGRRQGKWEGIREVGGDRGGKDGRGQCDGGRGW